MKPSKTGRIKSMPRQTIYSVAKTGTTFTVDDIPPVSSRQSLTHILSELAKSGKVKVIKKAIIGRWGGSPTIYQIGKWGGE